MISKIKFWLQRPYYFNMSISYRFMVCSGFSLFVFFFLYVFTPFKLYILKEHLLEYILGISAIVFFVELILFFLFPFIFKSFFKEDTWTIGKNVIFIIILLLITSWSLWFYNYNIKFSFGLKTLSLSKFIYFTFVVGLFPSLLMISLNEKNARNKKIKSVNDILSIKKSNNNFNKEEVEFTSIDTKESIKINIKELVYITSQSNYACFFIYESNTLKEYVIRITLKKVEELLTNYTEFYRCHKSYIINANYVDNIEGNARGYQLLIPLSKTKIPVSRNFPKELLKKIIK
ncbi:MAG: LytR/AlgR family response regulator transcription factor [Flavobacteriaceae bacterium]